MLGAQSPIEKVPWETSNYHSNAGTIFDNILRAEMVGPDRRKKPAPLRSGIIQLLFVYLLNESVIITFYYSDSYL